VIFKYFYYFDKNMFLAMVILYMQERFAKRIFFLFFESCSLFLRISLLYCYFMNLMFLFVTFSEDFLICLLSGLSQISRI